MSEAAIANIPEAEVPTILRRYLESKNRVPVASMASQSDGHVHGAASWPAIVREYTE